MAETIQEQYIRMNPRSRSLQPDFQARFPSGSPGHDGYTSDPFPVIVARGSGPRKWDIDGNEYVDYGMGSASLLLGHAHPEVVSALSAVLADGSHFGAPTEPMLEWGERVCTLMPCADKVRFVGSGAEATMLAMRVARGYTGERKNHPVGIPLPRMARLRNARQPAALRCAGFHWHPSRYDRLDYRAAHRPHRAGECPGE